MTEDENPPVDNEENDAALPSPDQPQGDEEIKNDEVEEEEAGGEGEA